MSMPADTTEVWGLRPHEVEDEFARLQPFLRGFAERDPRVDLSKLVAALASGRMQTWIYGDWQACMVTACGPDYVEALYCSGFDRYEWMDAFIEACSAFCRRTGRKHLFATVRPGWARDLKKRGWREAHRDMRIDL